MLKQVRTRFAPSPTGFMHLGGARTALFNFYFAHHFGGQFLVRIEDTDLKRNQEKTLQQLLFDLKWMGIQIDATVGSKDKYAPYQQSKRLDIYNRFVEKLIELKKVYPCFCTPEELKKERLLQIQSGQKAPQYNRKCWSLSPSEIIARKKKQQSFCLRFYVANGKPVIFKDFVYGKNETKREHIEDFIILKTDGYPTYNFAVVVDDHLMEITHIWRGSDHLSNTAKQILLYQAFNWTIPTFGHLSLIEFVGKKMSKRLEIEEQYISYYRQKGYLPEALVNYLSLLGWTPDKFQELFSTSELIKRFNGESLNKSQSVFSLKKLKWINSKKINHLSDKDWALYINNFLFEKKQELELLLSKKEKSSLSLEQANNFFKLLKDINIKKIITFLRKEILDFDNLSDLLIKYFLPNNNLSKDPEKQLEKNYFLFKTFKQNLSQVIWSEENINNVLKETQKTTGLQGRNFFAPLYFLMIGTTQGPPMPPFLFLFGQKKVETQFNEYFALYKDEKN